MRAMHAQSVRNTPPRQRHRRRRFGYRGCVAGIRGFGVAAFVAACSLVAAPAWAEPAGRLVFRRGPGVDGCPDETALRRAVASRLGDDPFDDAQPTLFDVTIVRDGNGLLGRVSLVDMSGTASGVREIRGAASCNELVDALALGLSLAINPELATADPAARLDAQPASNPREAGPREDATNHGAEPKPAAAPTSAPDDDDESSAPGGRPDWGIAGGVLGLASVGTAPRAALGVGALVRGRYGMLSLSLEGRYDPPADKLLDNGAVVETRLMAGLLVPCVHFRPLPLQACAVGALGSVQGDAPNLPEHRSDSGLYVGVGARGAVELDQLGFVRLQARLDVLGSLKPIRVTRNGDDLLWEMPRISGTLGLGALVEIP